jgi:hypothetical protein
MGWEGNKKDGMGRMGKNGMKLEEWDGKDGM